MMSNRSFFMIAAALLFQCTASAQVFDPAAFEGNWSGVWHNLTFSSEDSAFLYVTIDTTQMTVVAVLDLNGNVFGGTDPDSVVMTGSYTSNGFTSAGTGDPYGPISISGNASGMLTGLCPNVPNPGIDSVRFSGSYDDMDIVTSYIVYFAGGSGTANGTLIMHKQAPTVSVGERRASLPDRFILRQNYPNPFNPSTQIEYTVGGVGKAGVGGQGSGVGETGVRGQGSGVSMVRLSVYDIVGREVATLVNGEKEPGTYMATWDASGAASGMYFYRLSSASFSETKAMVLLK